MFTGEQEKKQKKRCSPGQAQCYEVGRRSKGREDTTINKRHFIPEKKERWLNKTKIRRVHVVGVESEPGGKVTAQTANPTRRGLAGHQEGEKEE